MNKYLDPKRYAKHASIILRSLYNRLFASTEPVSRRFGYGRGQPIDRYYMENFLERNRTSITGTVLEIGDPRYTRQFGTNVTKSEILHAVPGNPEATIVGDLADTTTLPQGTIDCFIATQTFQFIYDLPAAVRGAHYVLTDGGVLLATISGISQISRHDMDRWGDYWRMTTLSTKKLFSDVFGEGNVTVESHGNCLVACSFLKGLSSKELSRAQLDARDEDYQLLITVLARKA